MSSLPATERETGWDAFWFRPTIVTPVARVRGLLCFIAALYFLSNWSDAGFWYADGGLFSPSRVATFVKTGGLENEARWIVSPLFLVDATWVYQLYLVIGSALCFVVAAGRGGRVAGWAVWLMLVGWANRATVLSGLTETLLSLGLFAVAIAPPRAAWSKTSADSDTDLRWSAGFSQMLAATQITVVGLATFVTMLSSELWFNGLGAYSLAAPVQDRTIDWTTAGSWFVQSAVYETLTHLLVIAMPVGLLLAWIPKTNRIGRGVLIGWCVIVALLGSHWLYAASFAAMVLAIEPRRAESRQPIA